MGLPGTFCVVCGTGFGNAYDEGLVDAPEAEGNEDKYTADQFEWLDDIRLFGLASSLRSFSSDALIKEDHLPQYDTSKEEPTFFSDVWYTTGDGNEFHISTNGGFWTLTPNAKRDVLFAMHVACAEIIRRVVEAKADDMLPGDGLSSLRAYYDVLRKACEIIDTEYGIAWLHDYYGATDGWVYDSWEHFTGMGKFIVDPLSARGLASFVDAFLKPAQRKKDKPIDLPASRGAGGIEALPAELIQRIVDYLPINSVLHLRSCSKALASRIPLSQRMFRECLLSGNLVPYVWDLDPKIRRSTQQRVPQGADPDEYWDWKAMARLLADYRYIITTDPGEQGMPPGFWNRCRLWFMVEQVENLE